MKPRPLAPSILIPLTFGLLPLSQAAAQTTYSWRSEATSGSWQLAENWWDGLQTAIPAGNETLEFGNDAQPAMTNDLTATTRHKIMFAAGVTVARTIAGTTANAFEPMSGNGPLIQNDSAAAHAINFPITINTQNLTVNTATATGNLSLGGAITGSQGIVKQGTGVLTLSAVNSYAGKTSITNGAVSVDGDNRLGTAPAAAVADQLSLTNGGALRATGTATITFSANRGITLGTGGGALENTAMGNGLNGNFPQKITGTGALALRANGSTADNGGSVGGNLGLTNAANDFTGDVTIHSGVVNFAGDGSFGATANDIILAGGGLVATAARTLPATRDIVLSGGGDRIFRAYGGITFTINGAITGTGNVRHTDGGTLALTGANSFTGHVVSAGGSGRIIALSGNNSYTGITHLVNGSTIRLDANNTVPDTSSVLLYSNTVFNVNGRTDTIRGLFVGGTGDTNSTVNLGPAGSTGTLTITNNSMPTPAGAPTNIGADFYSKISGIGTIEYKNSTSDTALWNWQNTTNDFTGNILISRGRLRSALNAGAGCWGNVDNDIVFNGEVIASLANGLGSASVQGAAGGALVFPATRSIILNSGKEGTFYVWSTHTYTIDGQITGGGNLRKEDGGVLLLNNTTNNYSGLTRIAQGTLRVGAIGTIPDASGVEIAGGTFDTNLLDESAASLTGTGGNVGGGGTLTVLTSGTANYSGANNSTVRMAGTGTQTLDGTGDNANGWARVDSGTLVLAKASTSSVHAVGRTDAVGLTITGGTARLAGSGNDQLYYHTHVLQSGGVFDLNGTNEGFRALTGTGGTVNNGAATTFSELTLGQGTVPADSYTYAGTLADGAGQLALTKTGPGTQALTGSATYTGLTSVNEGRLNVNGTLSASAVSVAGSGTLGGTGTVTGEVAVALGSTIAPGATTGTLTVGSAPIDGTLKIALNGASSGRLNVTGALNITNAGLVVETPGAGATESVYIIASYGTLTGTEFASLSVLPDGYELDYNYQGNKQIALIGSATPYELWATLKNLDETNDAPTADPDKDGLTNLDEFAFDGDPLSGTASGKVVGAINTVSTDKVLTLTLPIRAGAVFSGDGDLVSAPVAGVTYKIQGSTSLGDFTSMNITEVTPAIVTPEMPGLTSTQWTYRTFRVPAPVTGAPKQFLRAVAE